MTKIEVFSRGVGSLQSHGVALDETMPNQRSDRERRFSPRANDPGPGIKIMMDRIVDLTQEKTRMATQMEAMRRDVMSLRHEKSSLLTTIKNASRDRRVAASTSNSRSDANETVKLVESISSALQAEIDALEKELSGRPTATCVACMERPRQIAYIPCGHFVVCRTCADRWRSCCPVCKADASSTVSIYNS